MKASLFFLVSFIFISDFLHARVLNAWEDQSDPSIMRYASETRWHALPQSSTLPLSQYLWAGDYWALKRGSLNYRWNAKIKTGFNTRSPSKDEVMMMSIGELSELSPAEKYDLLNGRYDYPFKSEVSKIANPDASLWEGMCHGWSAATLNHREPEPKLMLNPDGIFIPFGSSDIKGLISYFYGHIYQGLTNFQVGRRCYSQNSSDQDCSNDLNAGAFHIVLANRIGLMKKSFVLDMERFDQVWNHPVTGYSTQSSGEGSPYSSAAAGTNKVLRVKTTISYVDDADNNWRPVLNTSRQTFSRKTYEYYLELDGLGNIIGGEWISRDRPDFMWAMTKPKSFKGSLSRVWELLNDED